MNKSEHETYRKVYVSAMLQYQGENELTVHEMAEKLGISPSTYKNIIYGKTTTIDLGVIVRMYFLNKTPMYKMTGVEPPREFISSERYANLSLSDQLLVDDFITMLLKREGKDPDDL